jgi:hypothetical protein
MAALTKNWRRTYEKAQPLINIPHGPPSCLEGACGVIFERESAGEPASADEKPHSTSGSIQGLGYLLTALRRKRLASDKLVLQLATFLRPHDLFLELSRELSQPIRFDIAASRAQMVASFRAFIPVPAQH